MLAGLDILIWSTTTTCNIFVESQINLLNLATDPYLVVRGQKISKVSRSELAPEKNCCNFRIAVTWLFALTFDSDDVVNCRGGQCCKPFLLHTDAALNCGYICKYSLANVWADWAIYWTLGNFSSLWQQLILPKSPTFLGNFCKLSKSLIFLVKSFLGNFYRHLAIFYWSHCLQIR